MLQTVSVTNSARLRWALGAAAYGLLALFLVRYFRATDWRKLSLITIRPIYVLAAVPFSIGARLLQPFAWAELIRDYGGDVPPYPQVTSIYAKSWLGRYIPGKLAWIGGKVFLGRRAGVDIGVLTVTSVAEAGLQFVTALALSFLLFAAAGELGRLGRGIRLLAFVSLAAMTIVLSPPIFNHAVARLRYLLSKEHVANAPQLSLYSLSKVGLLYITIHGTSAIPLFFLVKTIYAPLVLGDVPYITASFLLAGTLGTLAVFAPSGLGVREGILLGLLAVVLPKEVSLIAVVCLRLWSVSMDLLFYSVASLLVRAFPVRG